MENQSISTHIVVVNQSNVKPAESKGNNTPESGVGADFANLLAAQIQGERPLNDAPAPANLDAAVLDEKDPAGKNTPGVVFSEHAAQDANPLISNLNLLSLAQIQGVPLEASKQAGSDKNESLSLETVLDGAAKVSREGLGSEKAANEIAGAAKFAASDKTLPLDAFRDVKVESNVTALTAGSLSPSSRVPTPASIGSSPLPTALTPVAVPVGNAGWDTAFSQRVVWVASNTQQVAQLQLNPPNLGPLEIRISLSSDQANAVFTSPHAVVRDAIEAALPRLREMLADNGLSLGNVNVSSESFRQQAQSGQSNEPRHDPFRELQRIAASADNAAISSQGVVHITTGNKGLVDIFA